MRLDRGKLFMATAACLALFNPQDAVAANWSAAKCQFQCSAKKCGTNTEFAKQCIQNCDPNYIKNCKASSYAPSAEASQAYQPEKEAREGAESKKEDNQEAKNKCNDSYKKCIRNRNDKKTYSIMHPGK